MSVISEMRDTGRQHKRDTKTIQEMQCLRMLQAYLAVPSAPPSGTSQQHLVSFSSQIPSLGGGRKVRYVELVRWTDPDRSVKTGHCVV